LVFGEALNRSAARHGGMMALQLQLPLPDITDFLALLSLRDFEPAQLSGAGVAR